MGSENVSGNGYLCQVNDRLSCGACCGLYNIRYLSRDRLFSILARRSELFATVPRNGESIVGFQIDLQSLENQNRPYSNFHHCPFIGLIGTCNETVGCLLHPLSPANKGVDFRGLSFYGGLACGIYFCPSHHYLPEIYKQILKAVVSDWYLYGLVVTERAMIEAFFKAIESEVGHSLQETDCLQNRNFLSEVGSFFSMKLNWPYRIKRDIDTSNFTFGMQSEWRLLAGNNTTPDHLQPFEAILKALNTHVNSLPELEAAARQIEDMVQRAAELV